MSEFIKKPEFIDKILIDGKDLLIGILYILYINNNDNNNNDNNNNHIIMNEYNNY